LGKYSAIVSVPKEFMKKLNWRKGQKVELTSERKTIKIKGFKN